MIQLARMMLYDDEESRDVVSEVFATLVKTDIMPRNVENYLMTSVRNRCRNLLEHKDVRAKFEQVYVTEMKQGSVEEDDDFSPMAVERKYEQVITYAKKQLTGQTLMVFQMRHLQGMKYQEIADQLGISKVMEKNEKIQMLLDMQEHPENYSEQELKTMLKDPEVRELMEATALLKQAMIWERLQVGERSSGMNARKNAVNVDAEWQRFAGQHIADSKPRRGWMKVAAVFLGVLFVSGITFAAIHIVRMVNSQKSQTVQTEQPMTAKASTTIPADTVKTDTIAPKIIRYDEATLQKILTDMGEYYRLRVELRNEDAKTLRLFFQWNQRQEASKVLEQLNTFERIHLVLNDSTIIAE